MATISVEYAELTDEKYTFESIMDASKHARKTASYSLDPKDLGYCKVFVQVSLGEDVWSIRYDMLHPCNGRYHTLLSDFRASLESYLPGGALLDFLQRARTKTPEEIQETQDLAMRMLQRLDRGELD